jgi:hypothetical protein
MMEVQPGLFVPLPKSLTIGEALDMVKTPCRFVGRDGSVRFGRSLGITLWNDEKERG